jgi:excisionase family DNA binding protein
MTPNAEPADPEFLTVEEVAGRLKVKDKTVREWIGRGMFDAYKVGKEWRIRRDHLDEAMEALRVSAQPAKTGGLWDPSPGKE